MEYKVVKGTMLIAAGLRMSLVHCLLPNLPNLPNLTFLTLLSNRSVRRQKMECKAKSGNGNDEGFGADSAGDD